MTTTETLTSALVRAWEQRKAEVCGDIADLERRAEAIQQKLDRLDEAFLNLSA
jgi:hypothetical protein